MAISGGPGDADIAEYYGRSACLGRGGKYLGLVWKISKKEAFFSEEKTQKTSMSCASGKIPARRRQE
jgi:hypothetical protein